MKFIDEYRNGRIATSLAADIRARTTRPWVLMEICGGQTHTIMRYGLEELLPRQVELVHGPGCPVCVTPLEIVDKAIAIASAPGVIFVSYGDMLRVPGSRSDLFRVKAAGGDVRIAYSPMDALKVARENPQGRVVFFGIGFETTAPANAMAVWQARQEGLTNFSMLVSHVLVPPAIRLILGSPANRVQGLIAPGHVCTIVGWREYEDLARDFHLPVVIAGFEPLDLLEAIRMLVAQLEDGRAEVENQYVRSVSYAGNLPAQRLMSQVFETTDRKWRGIGNIPMSGYRLREEFAAYDAEKLFGASGITADEQPECISALVLQGLKKPAECPAFGTRCTPQQPLGAPMVSSEGVCAAYHQYRRFAGLEAAR
ncbi:MAG TPA: hydrogenase formation protein HypD [Candidatus Sulfopaludibacter sp.]|jgi:hydrogenase expression/formation protein HypD|nr:hydrogenase formation protein HypD [Candidatus Sulfopaludibacter sp.]